MTLGMLALSSLPRSARTYTLGALAFLVSLMFGASFFPTPEYFWGIALGRLLLSVGWVFSPITNAGAFRPTLLFLTVLASATIGHPLGFVAMSLLYLLADITLDTLVLAQATEQDAPVEIGVLSCLRFLGLWCGLFLQHAHRAWLPDPKTVILSCSVLFFVFWLVTREEKDDDLIPTKWNPRKKPPLIELEDAIFHLRNSWALSSILNLLCTSLLAGLILGPLLPYPLLHPTEAGSWLESLVPHLRFFLVGIISTWLTEKFKLQTQLFISALWCLGLQVISWFPSTSNNLELVNGLLLASVLLAGRAVLRQSFRLPALLRSALLVTVWTLGGLCGAVLAKLLSSNTQIMTEFFCVIGICSFAALAQKRYTQPAVAVETPLHAKAAARFGDRIQDFEAGPTQKRKKKKRWLRIPSVLNFFLVSLPVWILLAATISGGGLLAWHTVKSKVSWEQRFNLAAKVFRTELFLSAFERRLTEEMLATSRIPHDWNDFIATSFGSEGEPLTDVDLWDTPYRFIITPRQVTIICAGPDRKFETIDDMKRDVDKPAGTLDR